MAPNITGHALYRVVGVRPKTAALTGAIAGVAAGAVQFAIVGLYLLLVSGILFGFHDDVLEPDTLFLLLPALLSVLGYILVGAFCGWLVAIVYNYTHSFFGTFSIRLSRTYVRD